MQRLSRRQFIGSAAALPMAPRAGAASPLDPDRLATIPAALSPFVDRRYLSGVVTLVWHRGRVKQAGALGFSDIERRIRMRRDSIFRIASMTKPIVSAATMMLVEEGKIRLDAPVTHWLPELSDMKVLRRPDGPIDDVLPAPRDITVEDLLTHRSGLAYGFFSSGPIAPAYAAALGDALNPRLAPDDWIAALGRLPLLYPPGDRMNYSHSTDVLGILISRVEGQTLGAVLGRRLFEPLAMADTAFFIPPGKAERAARLYGSGPDGLTDAGLSTPAAAPIFEAGGSGLFSTADDYLAFARMLLDEGRHRGRRVLRAESVREMRRNHLTAAQRHHPFIGRPVWAGMGFGLGLGVVDAPEKNLLGCGRVGSFGWPGAFGTWWQADPVEQLIMVYMVADYIPLTSNAGAAIAAARGGQGRQALLEFEKITYGALTGAESRRPVSSSAG